LIKNSYPLSLDMKIRMNLNRWESRYGYRYIPVIQ